MIEFKDCDTPASLGMMLIVLGMLFSEVAVLQFLFIILGIYITLNGMQVMNDEQDNPSSTDQNH
jgi:hypothetical protein